MSAVQSIEDANSPGACPTGQDLSDADSDEHHAPVGGPSVASSRLRAAIRVVGRFLSACIDAVLRDEIAERTQRFPEYRRAETGALGYHFLRQMR